MRNVFRHIVIAAATLGMCGVGSALAAPMLMLSPSPTPVVVGDTLNLSVKASDFTDLYGFQYTLNFNPAIYKAVASSEGNFLQTGGATFFDGGVIDNATGVISFVLSTLLGTGSGASGSGLLASFEFEALASGPGTFSFSDALFIDSNLNAITVALPSLTVSAVPEPTTICLMALGGMALLVRRRSAKPAIG